MKNLLWGLLTLISLPLFACQPQKEERQEPKKSVVPATYLTAMDKAESVTFLLIDPWSEETEGRMDGYGEVLAQLECTDATLKGECLKLLASPTSFAVSEMVKECEFMPDMAIVFHGKKGDVTVGFSTYCDLVRFAKGESDYADFDGETVRLGFLQLVAKAFPKDRYLRHLIKQTRSNRR